MPLLAGVSAALIEDLADAVEWLVLPGGATLFAQGEPSDALYLLRFGRLLAQREDADGQVEALGQIGPGEWVGEIGLITDAPRSAHVIAARDCELLRLGRPAFDSLIAQHPQAMLALSRIALQRFSRRGARASTVHCFCVLPLQAGLDTHVFAQNLARCLGVDPVLAVIDAAQAGKHEPGWFAEREAQASFLVYVGDGDAAWRERCVRQSDCVLLLADTTRGLPATRLSAPPGNGSVCHLVLLQAGEPPPGSTRTWLAAVPHVHAHHHVRQPQQDVDLARVARRLTGRATGLVLSGGGARGFAHIGVVRALREAGIEPDYIAGCSIGAIIGAGIAADWSHAQLVQAYRTTFVDTNPLSNWTLPLVSLRSGRKVSRLLRETFGGRDIEDLPIPFLCVSADLTRGVLATHTHGELWRRLRASCAIPGVLPPVFADGRVLVDGGVIDNLPVAELRKRVAGRIIAVDVGGNYRLETTLEETELPPWWRLLPEWFGVRKRPSLGQILLRAGMVNSAATAQRRQRLTSLLLKPELPGVDLLGWHAFERAVDLGYRYALREVGGPRDALSAETPVLGL